jgi:hypothetical protein
MDIFSWDAPSPPLTSMTNWSEFRSRRHRVIA